MWSCLFNIYREVWNYCHHSLAIIFGLIIQKLWIFSKIGLCSKTRLRLESRDLCGNEKPLIYYKVKI